MKEFLSNEVKVKKELKLIDEESYQQIKNEMGKRDDYFSLDEIEMLLKNNQYV